MKPVKVLALVTDAYGAYGGIAQYNKDLLEALAAMDGVACVTVLPRIGDAAEYPAIPKMRLEKAIFGRIAYSLKALQLAVLGRPDVIFSGHIYHGGLAKLLARLTRAKLVSQLHGTEVWKPLAPGHLQPLQKSDLVLCVSRDTMARYAEQAGHANNATVLHNTVASDYLPGDRIAARARFGLRQEFALLTVGRLDARDGGYKGHERVLRALPALQADGRDVVYLIAGQGDDRERLEALVTDLGLADNVRFLGNVPREDLPALYRAADLFALPSTGEGFGIVFLEAMASGTPAIGLNVGGASDALADGELGACVAVDEFPAALQNSVLASRPDPQLLHQSVVQRFGKEVFQHRVADIFRRLTGAGLHHKNEQEQGDLSQDGIL